MSKLQKIGIAADSPNTVTLPDHLIIDHILPRLPVKTLIRFKSVSKLWLSSISSPQFVKSHLRCSSSSSSCRFLFLIRNKIIDNLESSYKVMLMIYDELYNLKTPLDLNISLCFGKRMVLALDIVGCSNGLVCLHILTFEEFPTFSFSYHECSSFYVYNPATRAFRNIKNPECQQGLSQWFWFGYTPSMDDHIVVASFIPVNGNGRHIYVYSLRIGKWRIIRVLDDNLHFGYDRLVHSTTVIDDVLYCSLINRGYLEGQIIGFDFVNAQLKEFRRMDWLNKYNAANFFEMNGCLSLLCYSYSCWQIYDVWTLRKQDDWSSWEKSSSFHVSDMACYVKTITPTGKFLLGRGSRDRKQFKIISLNKDTQQLSLSLSQGDVCIFEEEIESAIGYVESLVSPFGSIEPNEEEEH